MSTTIHVGKSKTWTVTQVGGQPIDPSYTFGFNWSKEGSNLNNSVFKNSCTIMCTGVRQVPGEDWVPGQPAIGTCTITSHDGKDITVLTTEVYLTPADTAEVAVPLEGSHTMVTGGWGPEK